MGIFDRPELRHKPAEILSDNIVSQKTLTPETVKEDINVSERLMDHLIQIREWKDRVDAIDFLIASAEKAAGNPKFKTTDVGVLNAMKTLGYSGDEVDFRMFKECVNIIIEGYKQMALVSVTGVMDGD